MEHQESNGEVFEKFTWKIENFSQLNSVERIYSEPFVLGGYPWRIYFYPMVNNRDEKLSIYLEAVQMQTSNVSKNWSRDVKFRLVVFNQLDTNKTITNESKIVFNASSAAWGYASLMPLVELRDPKKGFIVNDVCIVGAEVFVGKRNLTPENRVSQAVTLTGNTNVEVQKPKPEVKDTKDKAREDLQVLWEELEKHRSDLIWLEPHVQSALKIKNYVEKALYVEKLKNNVVDQELETKRLKTKLVAAEENLNIERELLKAKGI
ncbi:hypothetical protein TSUD_341210 [Trifolium subterraneum]|uniref:MATH domain-containing protein n=1 Tax=Trifolium subterraneum TaxID=3900 RepID=A0A2Z6LNJ2_TRISU|nr:hypothetical protein TSUD_341210 [Trifolium subterraneum]